MVEAGARAMVREGSGSARLLKGILHTFEQVIVVILIVIMCAVIALATLDLGWIVVQDVMTPPIALLEVTELLEIFGFVLLVLIGIELLETIKAYLVEHVVHVEIVVEVALIAIARKVIVLETETYPPLTLLGIAGLILALALGFHLIRRGRILRRRKQATANNSASASA